VTRAYQLQERGQQLVTRYTESLGGDLGVTAVEGGPVTLALANLHGDLNTTLPPTGNATSIDTLVAPSTAHPAPPAPPPAAPGTGGSAPKQRSADTGVGLLLMGARLYNPTNGRFTSLDLNGRFGWRKFFRRAATVTGFLAAGACIVATAGACAVVTYLAIGASFAWNAYKYRNGDDNGHGSPWEGRPESSALTCSRRGFVTCGASSTGLATCQVGTPSRGIEPILFGIPSATTPYTLLSGVVRTLTTVSVRTESGW